MDNRGERGAFVRIEQALRNLGGHGGVAGPFHPGGDSHLHFPSGRAVGGNTGAGGVANSPANRHRDQPAGNPCQPASDGGPAPKGTPAGAANLGVLRAVCRAE